MQCQLIAVFLRRLTEVSVILLSGSKESFICKVDLLLIQKSPQYGHSALTFAVRVKHVRQ